MNLISEAISVYSFDTAELQIMDLTYAIFEFCVHFEKSVKRAKVSSLMGSAYFRKSVALLVSVVVPTQYI
jgi:glucan biosynthesis protein